MNKQGSFTGIGKVYNFTLTQLFKNKANMASFLVLVAVAALAVPVMALFMGDGETGVTFMTDVMTIDEFLGPDHISYDSRYTLQYAYSIIVMIVCIFSCTYIVRAIIEEKSSKLVETLMVSIRSEAMIMGKILAVISFVAIMVIAIVLAFALSYFVTGMFMDTSFIGRILENAGITSQTMNLGFDMIAAVVISILIGCLMLSLIAALSGAGCSTMEDMESANMAATMMILACYLVTVFAAPFGSGPAVILSLCPFISAFAAPTYYVTGDIGLAILILSWVIQIVCIFLLYKLSGKIYDSLIMYKGSRMKLGKIFSMALGRKEGK